jgi:predicted SnoaL-like aldol condensation-catalyzing enzyme
MTIAQLRRFAVVLALVTALGLIVPVAASEEGVTEQTPWGGVSRADNLAAVHSLFDRVFNDEDAAAAQQLIADTAVLHTTRFGDWTGPQGVLDYIAFVKRAYPDASFTLTTVTLSGNTAVLGWNMTASHIQMDPTEVPYAANVEIDGSAEVALSDAQIASISLDERSVAITDPQAVAYQPAPGQPY